MLNTHLIVRYRSPIKTDPAEMCMVFLLDILVFLEKKGIKYKRISGDSFWQGTDCVFIQRKISIGVYIWSVENELMLLDVECYNHSSIWYNIFNRPKDEERYSGEALNEFVRLVDEAVRNNDRIAIHRDWMDRTEYLSAIKSIR